MATASLNAFCATVTWDAGGGTDAWSTPANWNPNAVPTSIDDVIIANAGTGTVKITVANQTVKSVTVQNGATLWIVSQDLTVTNASTIDNGGTLQVEGSFSGSGALTVNGSVLVEGGGLFGSGAVIINSGGLMEIGSNVTESLIYRSVFNDGTITFLNSGTVDTTFNGATLANTGIIDIQNDASINPGAGSPVLDNNNGGVITKSAGGGGGAINFTVNNAAGATIQVQSGPLELNGGGTLSGACVISPSSYLFLGSGTFTMSGTPTVSGAGTLVINAATLVAGAGVDVTIPNLALSSGTISGAGAVRVSGDFGWDGGTITGSGPRVLNSTSAPDISCTTTNCLLDGAALQLQASATFSASSGPLVFSHGASLILDAGKVLSVTNNGDFSNGIGAASSIINNGTIWKKTAAGTSIIGVPVTLSGTSTVDLDTGTLQFGGGASVAAGATLDIAAGTTLQVTGGVFIFNSGPVSMPGSGDFKVSGGTLRVPTGITMTLPKVTQQGGVIDGGGTLILSGTSSWSAGTMGSATAPGGITRIDSGNTLDVTTAGVRTLTQSRLLQNNGTLNLPAASGINLSGSATIENNGTIAKNTSGTSTIQPRVENNNGATVSAVTGTIALSGGGIAAGAYDISSGATLTLGGGTFTVASTATVTGAGTLNIGGAIADISSGANVLWPNVYLYAGRIDGAGALHVSGIFTWSGGTIAGAGTRALDSSSTPVIDCIVASCTLDGAALELQASGFFLASANPLVFSNGASLTIDSGKTLSITNDGDFTSGVGGGSIINDGTFWKKTTAGASTIGVPVTLSGTSTVDIDTGTLQFVGGASVATGATLDIASSKTLEVTGGLFLFNSGAVSMPGSGDFTVSGGTLRVPTSITVTIPNVTLDGSGVIDGGGTLILSGTSNWLGGTMGSATAPGGITRIDSGNGLNVTPVVPSSLTQTRQLLNNGTLSYGSVDPNILTMAGNSRITNNGALNFNDGTIDLSGSALIENYGTITKVAGPGTITIYPRVENNNGATVSSAAGTIALAGGGTASGVYSMPSLGNFIRLVSGTFAMSGTPTVTGAGALVIDGATLDAGAGVDVTFNGFGLFSGTITGAGTVRVSGNFLWSGGTIAGSGPRVLNGTAATFACTLGDCLLDGAALQLQADVTYNTSSNALVFSDGASLTIDPGKSISITNGGDFIDGGGAASSIVNNGMFWKNSLNVSSTIGVPVTLSGTSTVKIDDGTLQFGGGASVVAGATLDISSTKTLEVTGGVFLFNSGPVVTPQNGDFKVSGGTLRVPTGVTVTVPNVTLQGSGVIDGAGTLILSGTSIWSGGTMSGSGTTVNPATKTLDITAPVTLSRTLQNDGTLTVSGDVTGSGTIDNGGTLNAAADLTLGVTVNNSGQVVTSNALSLAGGGTHTGTFNVTAPGSLSFSAGTHSMSGGSIGGTGTLALTGATVTVGSPFTIGALSVTAGTATLDANGSADAFTMTGGTLGGSGTLTLSNGGIWSGGAMNGSGTTINPAAKTLSITAPVTLDSRTLQNDGTLTVSGDVTGSGTIANGGTLNATADLTLGVTVNNSGQVATSNALSLAGGGTHSGSFTITAPGTLSFSSGTHSVSGSIGGTGTLTFSGATATVSVPVSLAALSVTAGTATLDANASADAFTMTGGTLGGTGTLTLNNGGTWSGGAMNGSGTTVNPATKTLTISAPVTLDSRTLQNNGTLSVSGNITGSGTIDNQGTLDAAGNSAIGAALNNNGQIATSGALSLTGGGTHTGSFTVTTPGNLSFSSGTHTVSGGGSIGGSGTLTFSGATATVGVPVTVGALIVTAGTATLDANASADAFTMNGGTIGGNGTLTLSNGGTWSGGTMSGSGTTANPAAKTLSISAPVTLDNRTLQNNGTLSVNGNVTGSGTIANNGTLDAVGNSTIGAALDNNGQIATGEVLSLGGNGTHSGTFTTTVTGLIDFSGGTQTISGALAGTGTVRFSGAAATVSGTWTGMPIEVAGGSVALDTNGTIPALTLTGGTLAGSGDVTVSGPSTWSGGMLAGNGALTFDSGATVTMPGTGAVTLARPLLNRGTIDFTAASNGMLIDGVAVTNDGTLDIQSSQGIAATAGTPPFVNHGILKKTSGAGVMLFAPPLANSGQVQIESGTMQFGGTYAQSAGTTAILSGATLQTATLSLNGGSLAGNGTVVGTVASHHAIVSPGASPGTLTIDGDYVQSPNAALEIQLGGTAPGTQYDRLLISGSATLGGTLNVTTINGFIPAPGNAFQIVTFGDLLATFAVTNGLTGPGAVLVPTAGSTDLQLLASLIEANLAVSVSAPASVAHGSAFAYTVSVFNGGIVDANGVSLTATLPPNVTFTGASPSICSGAPNLVCSIGALDNGSTATVVIDVSADGFGAAPISVLATASELDSNPANNSATASPVITAADVAIAVTGPVSTIAGTKAIYTVTILNNSPATATNVAVTATASPGLTFSGNSGACVGSFPCTIATIGPGQSATIHTAWDIDPSATGSVQLTVDASSAGDANPSNDSASAITTIGNCPTLTIVAPGEMTTRSTAEAAVTPFDGATYSWSIVGGTIDSGDGTPIIAFTAGEAGTVSLAVNVTGAGCTLGAAFDVTVKPPRACVGTATLTAPADGTTTGDAVVTFQWNAVEGASGYRLWLQEGDAPARYLGKTLDTTRTKIIPPGSFRWYVETLFDGCASHESERLALTILPGQDCASRGAAQLSAPANETPVTSAAVAFSWNAVAQALEYELWLAPSGGVPTLLRTTSDTSCTAVVPPGRLEWYVRAVFGGCASTESAHRAFTYTPPPECTSQRPLLIAPVEGERLTSPVSFEWTGVPGATSYELYVDGELAATTTSPHASGLPVLLGERGWHVRARLGEGCGALDSAESRLIVIAPSPSCAPLGAPVVSAPAQISSGIAGRIQWSFVPGATLYVVEISGDQRFPRASTSSSTVTTRQLPFTFTNQSNAPVARYVRVHAVDTNCVQPVTGEFSPVAVLSVLPSAGSATGSGGVALLTDPTDIQYTLSIPAELAGQSFTATPTVPWISVTPASGTVPPGGQTLIAVAHTAGLPPGTTTGSVDVTTTTAAGAVTTHATTPPKKLTIALNNIPGVSTAPKSTPPPDALVIPAVASVTNFIVRYNSDICVTNTSAQVMKYEINFVPTGLAGLSEGQKTNVSLEPGATMAINDIVATWFGGRTSTGTLEIRPVTEIDTSTSSAPVGGLANRITFASSRTFSTTAAGGTYGQYVPAVPYANFIAKGSALSLQHIAQSDTYHTNLGLVEGSGEKVSLEVRIYDAAGTRRASFHVDLNGGERAQLNGVLSEHGLALDDARIEVEVTAGLGKVTAYASVVDNATNDSQIVPPVTLDHVGHTKWIVPGVADLVSASGNSQTDVRIFNAGTEPADLTLEFYSINGGPATTRTIQLAAGEVRQLDRVLSFFALSGDAGALHITSAAPAQIVATARTYKQTDQGAYGQFIVAATPDEAVVAGSRPLQILQMEESPRFQSNIGFAEVSGNPVTLEIAVFRPNSTTPSLLEVTLEPNQYRQINSLLTSLGLGDLYNARISVRAISGEGRALAYGSLIDHQTGDPTYIPGQ